MEIRTLNTNQTKELAKQLAETLKPGDIIQLYGDLGSGKTTFTKFLTQELNSNDRVQSPTFVIQRHYNCDSKNGIKKINHLDLYRLNTANELQTLAIKEILQEKDSITIIEWPELAKDFLPNDSIKIHFKYIDEETRKVKLENV